MFVGAALCGRPGRGGKPRKPDQPPTQGGHTGPPLQCPPFSFRSLFEAGEAELGIMLSAVKKSHQPSCEIRGGSLSLGGIAEKPKRCQSLSFDLLNPEDLQHLPDKSCNVRGSTRFQ